MAGTLPGRREQYVIHTSPTYSVAHLFCVQTFLVFFLFAIVLCGMYRVHIVFPRVVFSKIGSFHNVLNLCFVKISFFRVSVNGTRGIGV